MAFKPVRYDSGKTAEVSADDSAVTYSKFAALVDSTDGGGFVVLASKKSGAGVKYISLEDTVSASDSSGTMLVMSVRGVQFDASIDASPTQSYVGSEVNFTGTKGLSLTDDNDTPGFYIQDVLDGKNTVRGYFIDATN